ncbi:pilus assembly protein N-terminal domain-containing protein [Chelatococcus daeguensis]|uniref:Pilus assembly protein n=3 Tax=Chelatococcaceae TaxID=2036754 RepID=A0AAC9JUJ0_9HYPH|nr:pilus assembly protein [Chelatococcus daeguensis]KZE28305.1 pilus assembly protein [Chelatococcus daeguensis]MBM3084327.1 pilus assembly protein N-terminal domain-containing protein [Chelatococcus daeguensis]CUA89444.1 Pilus formation protein N terminal region [Chelatococcus sambhunathii]
MMGRWNMSLAYGRAGLAAVAVALACLAASSPAQALTAGETVTVTADQARLVRLPAGAQTVVVGNPAIADVNLQRNGVLVVTGKSYGTTNLIAIDAGGNVVAESLIQVEAPAATVVTVMRGTGRESLSCTPNCQPMLTLGDDMSYFSERTEQAKQRNKLATGE